MNISAFYLSCCLLWGLMSLIYAGFEHHCTIDDYMNSNLPGNTVCGANLIDYVLSLCDGSMVMKKRGITPHGYHPMFKRSLATANKPGRTLEVGVNKNIFQSKNHADEFLLSEKRNFQDPATGIVCECCINNCTPNEFQEYCAVERRRRSVSQREPTLHTQRLLDEFREQMKAKNGGSKSPPMTMVELVRSPLIQALDRQKAINLHLSESSKRVSSEIQDEEDQNRYLYLKSYLKQKLADMLAEHNVKLPLHSDGNLGYNRSSTKDEQLLLDLWNTFRDDYEKELVK